jgi:hypothetical protein
LSDRQQAILADKLGRGRHHDSIPHFLHRLKIDAMLDCVRAAFRGIVFKEHS